jgi:hypothetical protein
MILGLISQRSAVQIDPPRPIFSINYSPQAKIVYVPGTYGGIAEINSANDMVFGTALCARRFVP